MRCRLLLGPTGFRIGRHVGDRDLGVGGGGNRLDKVWAHMGIQLLLAVKPDGIFLDDLGAILHEDGRSLPRVGRLAKPFPPALEPQLSAIMLVRHHFGDDVVRMVAGQVDPDLFRELKGRCGKAASLHTWTDMGLAWVIPAG